MQRSSIDEILEWIDQDVEVRAALIAHAAPRTLNDAAGGKLTRELLVRYSHVEGVKNGITAIFNSGGWSGPTSLYYKKRRDKFRVWLSAGFQHEVVQWIEEELDSLNQQIERAEIDEERDRFT